MSIYFADASALAKRYIPDVGSAWVQNWINPGSGHITIISALSTVEFISLLARRRREGGVSNANFNQLRLDFLAHVQHQYRVIALSPGILRQAQLLVAKHPLRTLDALQLASAQIATETIGVSMIFVSGDKRLLTVATAEGFSTDDPGAHS